MTGKSRKITDLPSGLYADHQSGRVLSVPDTRTDPRTAAAFDSTFAPLGIRAYLSAPLMRDGVRVAALAIVDDVPRAWTLRETQILQAASERCWLWVEHLRLLRVLQGSVAELRTIRGDLEERVEQRTRELKDSLREKEALLKEVHHRVKNNLQVISSLLKLQALHLPDPAARAMFVESQARVQSIALVHEKLYQAKDLSNIPFNEYVHSLMSSLLHAQNADGRGISANLDIAPIHLSVEHAIPCGLILNELVTNSLKHAFPDGRGGAIHVMLRRIGSEVQLTVGDDGVGLPDRIEPREARSLGLDLVFTFAEQLDATVKIRRSPGTEFRLAFREEGT
jgi:two-component sensor histidine kinase